MYKIRYDILICIILSTLTVLGVGKLLPGFYSMLFNQYTKNHTIAAGDIGGKAGDEDYRAESVEDILSHDTFTVKASYSSVVSSESAFYGDMYLLNLELPSGERVAAWLNKDAMEVNYDEDYYILPVGRVVKADLSEDTEFLDEIERFETLSRKDFYLDMRGNAASSSVSPEKYDEQYTEYIQTAAAVISFIVFHFIGCKLGIFPPFIRRKKKNRDII